MIIYSDSTLNVHILPASTYSDSNGVLHAVPIGTYNDANGVFRYTYGPSEAVAHKLISYRDLNDQLYIVSKRTTDVMGDIEYTVFLHTVPDISTGTGATGATGDGRDDGDDGDDGGVRRGVRLVRNGRPVLPIFSISYIPSFLSLV